MKSGQNGHFQERNINSKNLSSYVNDITYGKRKNRRVNSKPSDRGTMRR